MRRRADVRNFFCRDLQRSSSFPKLLAPLTTFAWIVSTRRSALWPRCVALLNRVRLTSTCTRHWFLLTNLMTHWSVDMMPDLRCTGPTFKWSLEFISCLDKRTEPTFNFNERKYGARDGMGARTATQHVPSLPASMCQQGLAHNRWQGRNLADSLYSSSQGLLSIMIMIACIIALWETMDKLCSELCSFFFHFRSLSKYSECLVVLLTSAWSKLPSKPRAYCDCVFLFLPLFPVRSRGGQATAGKIIGLATRLWGSRASRGAGRKISCRHSRISHWLKRLASKKQCGA